MSVLDDICPCLDVVFKLDHPRINIDDYGQQQKKACYSYNDFQKSESTFFHTWAFD